MKATYIPRIQTNSFSEQQLFISDDQNKIKEFIGIPFSKEAFPKQIEQKSANYKKENRKILQSILYSSYQLLENNTKSIKNIEKLSDSNCFTITTGHQLSLLTGPVYFIYKILHVIKSCQVLNETYPDYHFVPIFWMASEDHDFEEIKSVSLFGKTINWETEQKGPVGRMNLSGLTETLEQFKQFFSNHPESELIGLIEQLNGKTYGEAFFRFVHRIFADYGLVILDGNKKEFKEAFSTILKKEVESQFSFNAVEATNDRLKQHNFKIQVNPREINLFYLSENKRDRIIADEDGFKIGTQKLTKEEIESLIDQNPQSFSPNVILRPLYQEFLLPNLCYVGGVGELSYWLQLKSVFDKAEIIYPLIQARTSAIWIDPVSSQKMEQYALSEVDLFKPISELKKQLIKEFENDNIDFSLIDFQFKQLKSDFENKAESIDNSLSSKVGAEFSRIEKQIDNLKAQLEKSIKNKHEKSLSGIEQLKNKLFPNQGLQERTANFFQFCPDGKYKAILNQLIDKIDPFNPDFLLIKKGSE
jgi:bacillithiol biosynthesis cysteine-adding enzyme BshC